MSEPMNFRSAFNGFNREDVVHYIEYLNANHENQIKQLQADLANFREITSSTTIRRIRKRSSLK